MPDDKKTQRYCALKIRPEKPLPVGVDPGRARLIQVLANKWLNGTKLRYCFVPKARFQLDDGSWKTYEWSLAPAQLKAVREAFERWKELGIGLEFEEIQDRAQADIRIGFLQGGGSWSYVGRDIRTAGVDELTMNLGWDVSQDIDTAVHEIGHSLGFPHEHQNPNAGIEWDEAAVYAALAKPPNSWSKDKTFYNIIRKIEPDTVQGSAWDPNSIMHYPFEAGLIKKPEQYKTGLHPAGGLSARDIQWVKSFYPPLGPAQPDVLERLQSQPLTLKPAEQKNFILRPTQTRDYEIATFGESDTVIVLYERSGGGVTYIAGDDDGGENRNARLKQRLIGGREYELRVRLYYATEEGGSAVMWW